MTVEEAWAKWRTSETGVACLDPDTLSTPYHQKSSAMRFAFSGLVLKANLLAAAQRAILSTPGLVYSSLLRDRGE
jgi:hypothetical protein